MDVNLSELEIGDMVYADATIVNDGGIPELAEDAVLAEPGTRGVIVNTGYVEEQPEQLIYLVRFEDANGDLGPPTGCLPEELRAGTA